MFDRYKDSYTLGLEPQYKNLGGEGHKEIQNGI